MIFASMSLVNYNNSHQRSPQGAFIMVGRLLSAGELAESSADLSALRQHGAWKQGMG